MYKAWPFFIHTRVAREYFLFPFSEACSFVIAFSPCFSFKCFFEPSGWTYYFMIFAVLLLEKSGPTHPETTRDGATWLSNTCPGTSWLCCKQPANYMYVVWRIVPVGRPTYYVRYSFLTRAAMSPPLPSSPRPSISRFKMFMWGPMLSTIGNRSPLHKKITKIQEDNVWSQLVFNWRETFLRQRILLQSVDLEIPLPLSEINICFFLLFLLTHVFSYYQLRRGSTFYFPSCILSIRFGEDGASSAFIRQGQGTVVYPSGGCEPGNPVSMSRSYM